jgi:SAM-dependent methyltransferase
MLRSLVSNLLGKGGASRPSPLVQQSENSSGAVVFVASIGEPVRIMPQMQLYSDHASLRLRAFAPMLRLAARRTVHLVPAAYVAAEPDLAPLQPVSALVITKFSTGEVSAAPATFDALIAALARLRGRTRLFADLCDNYAAMGDALGLPTLRRYQEGLAEHCALTVPCAALAEELAPIARHGIETIEDPFESPRSGVPRAGFGDPVRVCWFGSLGTTNADTIARGLERALAGFAGHAVHLDFVTHEARESLADGIGARLREGRPWLAFQFMPWSLEATWHAIEACDLVVLPQDHRDGWGRVKSHNRLVETIRGGRLAIASPIASYLELADYAWVGEDLGAGVAWALANPEQAADRVRAGQPYVQSRFSPERIVERWEGLLLGGAFGPGELGAGARGDLGSSGNALRLNLGCGDKILPGYLNVDVAPARVGKAPDVLCDLRDLKPFATASADEVLAVHVVEHFWRWEVVAVLKEWVRVLKPGGRMILECPNLVTACEEVLRDPIAGAGPGPEGQRTMWVLYGDPAWQDPLMCHRWNYTPQSLGQIMAEAGLVNVRQEPAQFKMREPRDMRIVGEKPRR